MRRDKYIIIQSPTYTQTESGGTRAIYTGFWSGWAKVSEGSYNTGMQEGQFAGNKGLTVELWKNAKTNALTTEMRISYRDKIYLINSIIELDRFTLKLTANLKELVDSTIFPPST
jgi:head-tail adaptor